MWIALFVFGVWTWVSRNKKKTRKPHPKVLLFALVLVGLISINSTLNNRHSISGTLVSPKKGGTFVVYLVDKEQAKIPLSGIDTVTISGETGSATFRFQNVKEGRYALRCFQDMNGNGTLDKGMFGPTEPYGFSRTPKGFPIRFSDIAFNLNKDKFINIKLK